MASEDLAEIVRSIMSEDEPDRVSDIDDEEDFCTMVGGWVSNLNAIATDEAGVVQKGRNLVVQAMQGESVSRILDEGLEEDIDTDEVELYVDALVELKEMAREMNAAYPRTYAAAEAVSMRM